MLELTVPKSTKYADCESERAKCFLIYALGSAKKQNPALFILEKNVKYYKLLFSQAQIKGPTPDVLAQGKELVTRQDKHEWCSKSLFFVFICGYWRSICSADPKLLKQDSRLLCGLERKHSTQCILVNNKWGERSIESSVNVMAISARNSPERGRCCIQSCCSFKIAHFYAHVRTRVPECCSCHSLQRPSC